MTNEPSEVALSPQFKRDLRTLVKRYRSIRKDIQPLVEKLQAGETPGNQLVGINYEVFKVRLRNSNLQKGKRAGDRVIYYLKTQKSVVLVTIYSKSDTADVSNAHIEATITQNDQND